MLSKLSFIPHSQYQPNPVCLLSAAKITSKKIQHDSIKDMTWNTNITPSNQTVKLKINMLTWQIKLECINKEEEEEDKSSSSRHYT